MGSRPTVAFVVCAVLVPAPGPMPSSARYRITITGPSTFVPGKPPPGGSGVAPLARTGLLLADRSRPAPLQDPNPAS